ncbi:hypothetical protein [Mycoplasma sp. Z1473D]
MKKSKLFKSLVALPSVAVLPLLPIVSAQSENNGSITEFKQKIVALKDLTEKLRTSFTNIYYYLKNNNYPFQKDDPKNMNVKSLEYLNRMYGQLDAVYKLLKKLSDANFDTKEQYFKLATENGLGNVTSETTLFKFLENWISNYVIRRYDIIYDNFYMNFQIDKLVKITKNPEVGTFLREHMMTDYEEKSDAFEKAFADKVANNTFTVTEAQSFVLDLLVLMNENVGKYIREIKEKYYKSLTINQGNSLDAKVNDYSNNTTDKIASDDIILNNIYSLYNTMNQAGQLNETMTVLRDTIEKAKKELGTINYTEASNEPSDPIKDNFSRILDEASNVINGDGNSDTEQQINELIKKLTAAQEKLDGKEQIQKTITNEIDNYDGVPETLKNNFKEFLKEISSNSQYLKELNDYLRSIKEAKKLLKKAEEIKKTVNYTQASKKPNKSNFDSYFNGLRVLTYDENYISSGWPVWPIGDVETDSSLIKNYLMFFKEYFEPLKQAIENLNGNKNLADAKADGTNAINQLNDLEKAQKDEFLKQIDSLEDISKINEVKNNAEKANEEAILNKAKAEATSYVQDLSSLTSEEKNTYIQQINKVNNKDDLEPIKEAARKANQIAKDLVAKKQEAAETIKGLDSLTNAQKEDYVAQVNQATNINQIDPIVNSAKATSASNKELADKKAQAEETINDFTYLSNNLKDQILENIKLSTTVEQVEQVLNPAVKLNEDAKTLVNAINEFSKNTKSYVSDNSDISNQEKQLQEINNQMVTDSKLNVSYSDQQVLEQIEKLSNFKQNVDDANNKLESAKTQLITLIKTTYQNLNKAQKDKFEQEIQSSNSFENINMLSSEADKLNSAMGELITANNENKELLKDVNLEFCNSDDLASLKAHQEIIDKLIDLEKGIIYKDNTAASINELMTQTNTLVQNVIKNVADNETAKTNFINPMQEKLDNYNNLLTSNKFFNAPNAMLTHLRELVTSFENQLNTIANNNKYLTQEEMDTLNSATSGIDSLVEDLSHFSDKVFTNSIGQRIKEFTSWVETNMLHTSDQYQENALNTYNNSMSYTEAVAAKQNAETDYNNLMNNWKAVEDKIADAIKTMTYTNTIENDIKQLIGLNDNIYSDLNTLNNTTKVLAELNDAYQAFLKTNATKKFAFLDAKHNLASKLNTHIVETARSSEMSALITEADTKFAQTLNDAKLIFKLASALENRNEEAFQKAMSSLTSNTNISNFAKLLVQNNYFNDVKVAESSSNAAKELHNIFNSQDFKDAPKVLQTLAMINVAENKEAFPWWTCLLIFGALIFLGGILTYIFKNK